MQAGYGLRRGHPQPRSGEGASEPIESGAATMQAGYGLRRRY